ncbi:Cys-tRNA(Pro) deacylase [Jeotgalibacillus proteolyticus]|uniref:Cys-tRNA(Pro)/Cys-tRNA(Cys) deacylase n=1 Tax=Jeotgalibacillus proteolyticus TaxID=2082395 RepID=A0A2S5G9Y9_9BACL|nr:Cys-tRNA(Pro) deacylase [Jeotgalibacillus proteolyticus]PPA69735.1 Cys-tRNA(Pro) deacylase [Jeotgalibacillus proteolyticus]
MAKKGKTNAMRQLDANKIQYKIHEYDFADGLIDGISAARKISRSSNEVYKTLVTQSQSKNYYVFLVPVDRELHLKKAAAAAGEKKVEMIPVKDLQTITGYIKGGCSPIGMKKKFPTYIAKEAKELSTLIVSAGQIGKQIELETADLLSVTNASAADLME